MSGGKGHNTTTHGKIVDAFWDLYCEKDIRDITVSELTERAGLHRVTFYRHFKNVEEVLREIEDSLLDPENLSHSEPLDLPENSGAYAIVQFCEQYYFKNAKYFSVLLGTKGDPQFVERCIKHIDCKSRQYGHFQFGELDDPLFAQALLRSGFSGCISLLNYWHQYAEQLDMAQIRKVMNEIYEKGLACFWKVADVEAD